jgi:hypothetical protein
MQTRDVVVSLNTFTVQGKVLLCILNTLTTVIKGVKSFTGLTLLSVTDVTVDSITTAIRTLFSTVRAKAVQDVLVVRAFNKAVGLTSWTVCTLNSWELACWLGDIGKGTFLHRVVTEANLVDKALVETSKVATRVSSSFIFRSEDMWIGWHI